MHIESLKKSIGTKIQIEPLPYRLDATGLRLADRSDDWLVGSVAAEGVQISNIQTGHSTTLGLDHIHHFTSNPDRSRTERFGFLTLNVQMYVQGANLHIRPTVRPGERLPPPPAEPQDKWVDIGYPASSGLQARLEACGYRLHWCSDRNISRKIDLEGWEPVLEPIPDHGVVRFRVRTRPDCLTLLQKKAG